MSEEKPIQETDGQAETSNEGDEVIYNDKITLTEPEDIDYDFARVVLALNESPGSARTMIIFIGGKAIKGDLISCYDYYEAMAEAYKQAGEKIDPEGALVVHNNYMKRAEESKKKPDKSLPRYFHMKNTKILGSPKHIDIVGPILRGRISQLQGFWNGGLIR